MFDTAVTYCSSCLLDIPITRLCYILQFAQQQRSSPLLKRRRFTRQQVIERVVHLILTLNLLT